MKSCDGESRCSGTLKRAGTVVVAASLIAVAMPMWAATAVDAAGSAPAARLVQSLSEPGLRDLVTQVLDRNPRIAAAEAQARAARLQAPQAKALPDPMLGVTGYVSPPETRVGPQDVMGTLSQRFPWFGKLGLKEKATLRRADALDAQVEVQRLDLVTEARRLYYEIGFLDSWRGIVSADRETLIHYEELARTRYSSGSGIEQAVIKIQAEITKADTRLLDIRVRRASLVASLNSLRDLPQTTVVATVTQPDAREVTFDSEALRARALRLRPEMTQADLEIDRADVLVDLARAEYKPDITLGVSYTLVGLREDMQGVAAPPPDNGKNVFAVSASINLPIRRGKLKAGVEEAAQMRLSANEGKRASAAAIDRSLGELTERVSLTWQQLHLLKAVLGIQADQSLRSAEAAYAAGTLNSLDLLDAERVLLDVQTVTARTHADYEIAVARLAGAVGGPLGLDEGALR